MAEYWASAWERKEGQAAEAAAALHRAEVRQPCLVRCLQKRGGAVLGTRRIGVH